MEKYRSEFLLEKYSPTVYRLSKEVKIDWESIDNKLENKFSKLGLKFESNIFGLMLLAESGYKFSISFLEYLEFLASSLEKITFEKKKFRDMIIGKITNLESLNYLNPIGELSVLKRFTDRDFKLVRIEDKQFFPTAKPKDFVFLSPKGDDIIIEVVNIHIKKDYTNLEELKKFLKEKLIKKIENETIGISIDEARKTLYFQPVLWHIDLEKYKQFAAFFKNFSNTFGKEFDLGYKIIGFCTFGTIEKTDFIFGELSTFYDIYDF